mmetsp:Transcript_15149/g.29443  ORF Transcript_15149/g.29443 Transcript_15149/m.29443 type:complete len:267 (+) Transcript_15149:331-1131(+)
MRNPSTPPSATTTPSGWAAVFASTSLSPRARVVAVAATAATAVDATAASVDATAATATAATATVVTVAVVPSRATVVAQEAAAVTASALCQMSLPSRPSWATSRTRPSRVTSRLSSTVSPSRMSVLPTIVRLESPAAWATLSSTTSSLSCTRCSTMDSRGVTVSFVSTLRTRRVVTAAVDLEVTVATEATEAAVATRAASALEATTALAPEQVATMRTVLEAMPLDPAEAATTAEETLATITRHSELPAVALVTQLLAPRPRAGLE